MVRRDLDEVGKQVNRSHRVDVGYVYHCAEFISLGTGVEKTPDFRLGMNLTPVMITFATLQLT